MSIEKDIQQKAEALGIDKCGIIRPEAMLGYEERLWERIRKIPRGESYYANFTRFADIKRIYPWARSIVVVVLNYGHYRIPESAQGRYGKSYLTDSRFNPDSPERKKIFALEKYLHELGIRTETSEHPGLTAMRWAARQAGLGIIRRNNFFYTQKGSWSRVTAWITDKEMELKGDHSLPECPAGCDRCIAACPTKSLSSPYTMNMGTCVSRLTASNDPPSGDCEINRQLGGWIYGCDVCQDVCPMNRGKWTDDDDFPGLMELGESLAPEKILAMDYEKIARKLMPKFFYIDKEHLWKWKLNAINAILNDSANIHKERISAMLTDEYERGET
ncbi:MAG: epoxyqueuosine reductase [Gracilibacteraceae bacterium]|jgi:epoxyqueuosine reductase|nr:epoxyqueuosine reductase [Gracilibacteraceae bacterium]